jgi:hypothetical protein
MHTKVSIFSMLNMTNMRNALQIKLSPRHFISPPLSIPALTSRYQYPPVLQRPLPLFSYSHSFKLTAHSTRPTTSVSDCKSFQRGTHSAPGRSPSWRRTAQWSALSECASPFQLFLFTRSSPQSTRTACQCDWPRASSLSWLLTFGTGSFLGVMWFRVMLFRFDYLYKWSYECRIVVCYIVWKLSESCHI